MCWKFGSDAAMLRVMLILWSGMFKKWGLMTGGRFLEALPYNGIKYSERIKQSSETVSS